MMMKSRKMLLALMSLLLAVTLTALAMADGEDGTAAMRDYWRLVGNTSANDPLTRVMNGESVSLAELTQVTAEELMAFAVENKLPLEMAQFAWYNAMADGLSAQGTANQTLSLFLSMRQNWRDASANTERRSIRRSLTEADIQRMSVETGLPGGFLAWILLDDEWFEGEWDGMDDWREGRSQWDFADWVDERELRSRYGSSAVIDDDEVERVLRKAGLFYDDD